MVNGLIAAALTHRDLNDLLIRLALDLASMTAIAVLFLRRHRRRDLVLVFAMFNVGVFTVLTVITEHAISAGVGFGLFALLSIIRLRSEPFGNVDLAYFFVALVLAVVSGIGHVDHRLTGFLSIFVILAVYLVDHQRIQRPSARMQILMDSVLTDPAALRLELERRVGVEIVSLQIVDVDYVRETTTVVITHLARGATGPDLFLKEDPEGAV